MVCFLGGDDGGIRRKHEVDSWIGHQVGLEFGNINVKGTVESQRSSQRGNDLSNKSVEVGVGWSLNVEVSSADIIDSFVVEHDCNISVFKERVGGEDGIVWFNDCSGNLGRWVDGESEFGFLSVVD